MSTLCVGVTSGKSWFDISQVTIRLGDLRKHQEAYRPVTRLSTTPIDEMGDEDNTRPSMGNSYEQRASEHNLLWFLFHFYDFFMATLVLRLTRLLILCGNQLFPLPFTSSFRDWPVGCRVDTTITATSLLWYCVTFRWRLEQDYLSIDRWTWVKVQTILILLRCDHTTFPHESMWSMWWSASRRSGAKVST